MTRQRVLKHVAIVRIQVAQPRFLLSTLPRVLAQPLRTLAVLGDQGEEVEGAADGGETHETKREGVTLYVLGSVARQETEGSDGPAAVAEADLERGADAAPQVSTDCWKKTSDDEIGRRHRCWLTVDTEPTKDNRKSGKPAHHR